MKETGPCVGCGRTTGIVDLVVHGEPATELGVPSGTVVDSVYSCERCEADSARERRELRGQFRRLLLRGISRDVAQKMMCRRVDRFFQNGTFVPMGKKGVA